MRSQRSRVGCLSWNGSILSSGSGDGQIHNHDISISPHCVATLSAHKDEVCGLQWSRNGKQLASGSKDHTVCIWDSQAMWEWRPTYRLEHTGPVKALSWCPLQSNLLATVGGTLGQNMRFWSSWTGTCIKRTNTNSQVCSILWSPHHKEIVTGHGYPQYQLTVWHYPSLAKITELKGHSSPVLHMSLSPDGKTVASASISFWKVFTDFQSTNESLFSVLRNSNSTRRL